MEEVDEGFILVPRDGGDAADAPDEYLSDIDDFVGSLADSLWPLNLFIHANPELAFNEFRAHDALTKFMRSQKGWRVTPSAYGLETAWTAVYDSGRKGPVVSFNAEMDALPNIGHACGHNLIATASVAAGLATAEMMRQHHLPGKVIIIGTPGEEGGGGGKIRLLERGAYRGVDVSLISHPGVVNNSPLAVYTGRAAHAANAPWQGVNALDALVIAYGAVSALRQQTRPDDVIGLQIIDGGGAPNVIHAHAAGLAVLRSSSAARLEQLRSKVEACFRAGAVAAGATVHITTLKGYADHVPNRVLAASYTRCWEALPGEPPEPPIPSGGRFTFVKASTDQGNISYALPSVNASFAIPPGPKGGRNHSPDFEEAAGTRVAFERALRVGKALAGTAVDVLAKPGMLETIKEQWKRDMKDGLDADVNLTV
ncbi:peptidase M20 domain containing 2 [Magnaporthiopsis poae ATCC 64411]|uniref:Peptidase M20 domain-containing protein 2 n=1 Tax=Magnaporthiopsis poae (strain ATCC 64411 / 73-15) TaxID=644358 RepID=A0A0C4DSC3_MAGP6|nr:peptidase M20 domain containing 2 [Magnaporthiopsis poae ATCC 64411]